MEALRTLARQWVSPTLRATVARVTRAARCYVMGDDGTWSPNALPQRVPADFLAEATAARSPTAVRQLWRRWVRQSRDRTEGGVVFAVPELEGTMGALGCVTPAFAVWCVRHGVGDLPALARNPACTPAARAAVRVELEAHLSTYTAVAQGRWAPGVGLGSWAGADLVTKWLAFAPADADAWPLPLRSLILDFAHKGCVQAQLWAARSIPPEVLHGAYARLWGSERPSESLAALLVRAHPPVAPDQMVRDLQRHLPTTVLAAEILAVLPLTLQSTCWRAAYQGDPDGTLRVMARCPDRAWPGLTADDLQMALSSADAANRVAAIQLLVQVGATTPVVSDAPPAPATPLVPEPDVATRDLGMPPASHRARR